MLFSVNKQSHGNKNIMFIMIGARSVSAVACRLSSPYAAALRISV
jgi:hypothetical protein